jgi:hypothetical protein
MSIGMVEPRMRQVLKAAIDLLAKLLASSRQRSLARRLALLDDHLLRDIGVDPISETTLRRRLREQRNLSEGRKFH